jgi:diaminohydroxyphosphoribosylaminopyrimidine deaminase/5-amino-6-(5-phosphoribosylamino)uracil reductase
MSDDLIFMRRAIALAQANLGRTGVNPSVGCVIVLDGHVVGEGATGEGGRPHAEEVALAQAGVLARGAVAYVTLEPCGERSSGAASCSSLLISHGTSRVVIACADASTLAHDRGPEALRAAGVPVEGGLLADEAAQLYRDYRPILGKPLERRN